ncbi:hypothetical protein B7494_g180 [Chlorociboria aeruginascens]|nr:hypothetical protein B7494_g180 [Chlorociboria aeruginascens]
MASGEMNRYWIPNLEINKKVITKDIQYYLGPEATVRPFTREEQIDDICLKSKEEWEKQAAARSKKESEDWDKLKRPLHQPVVVSRGSKSKSDFSRHRRSDDRGEGTRRYLGDERYGESSRW